ncbi:MAG TPA: LysM peptidoglycan-binding domain-containing protein, partial [Epsilonproteobacteria bacterium]|nr:LysM peptidoglycan-binding domain-containing protein [Campylobacterota bacterium]
MILKGAAFFWLGVVLHFSFFPVHAEECLHRAEGSTSCDPYTSEFKFFKHSTSATGGEDTMSVPDRSGTEVSHLLNNETDAFLAMIRNAYEKKKNKKRVEDFTLLPSKEVNPYLIEPVEKQVETFKAPFIPEHTPVVEVDEYAVALQDEVSSLPVTGSTTTEYGIYRVKSGDALERIARKFKVKTRALAKLNGLKLSDILHIGDPINIPYSQEMVDYITSAEYTVKQGDTLITIAQKFDLTARKLATFNKLDVGGIIGEGKKLKLPLPYKLAEIRAREALKNKYKNYGNKKLRVTATAYTSHH